MSHARGHFILEKIEIMLACRAYGYSMFHARKAIKFSRMALLHQRCAEILRGEDVSEADLYLVGLFEKYLPIVGALSSGEYRKLLDGIELVPSPFEPVGAGGMCRSCRNLNLRRESFQVGSSRFLSSAMGDLSPDGEYSDEELEKKVPYNPTAGAVSHHKLGDLVDIAKRSKCSICRLVTDCFQRLSAEELSSCGYGSALDEWFYSGVVWLSHLHDPIGDHQKYSHFRRQDGNPSLLESMEPSDRTRLILTILPQDKKPENTDLESNVYSLHTEIFAITDEEDANFQVHKQAAPFINMTRPQKWLHACETFHGKACSAPANYENMEVHEDMLLIDMEDGCLVSGFKGRRYFALSYVWGTAQRTSFQARKAVMEDLMKLGSLSIYLDEIAATIHEAMQVTKEMKCRYLWVDALCIVQDDEESKPFQIEHMDAIYRQAILTIVAGDCLSAKDKIYGLGSNPRETIQRTYSYRPGLTLTANEATYGDIEVEVMLSEWASRAWTFQERILSRRLLIFVNSTVHWSCSCLRWSEAEHNPSEERPPPWVYYNDPIFHDSPTLYMKRLQLPGEYSINFVWQNVVKTFTTLTLTYERDVLLAIAGLESYIAQYFDTSYIFGHPQKNFLDFLIWLPRFEGARRRNAIGIPSWSWASWVANICYPELEPHRKKYPKLRIPIPTWDNASITRVSTSCPHLGVLDIYTMISKLRIVGSMDAQIGMDCPEVGSLIYSSSMPLAVLSEAGKCIGRASISKGDNDFDGEFEAIVIADKLKHAEGNLVAVLTYWIMIIEWKGELAERIGLGVVTAESWSKANPVWRDVKLG
ncbi:HET-domain-containing protein [Hyaloscypha variabilis F]|uniref:HET-domain-containing protein n=1 Tax=Hyaloscypha variabilis (strain UAMH 11265 / GT02V1 / F) TaxID=1149755 RepID=A0A2J6S5A0_HYAVF|nr:HET-domain-containing protein [Hyaloscypha variabilis F]